MHHCSKEPVGRDQIVYTGVLISSLTISLSLINIAKVWKWARHLFGNERYGHAREIFRVLNFPVCSYYVKFSLHAARQNSSLDLSREHL